MGEYNRTCNIDNFKILHKARKGPKLNFLEALEFNLTEMLIILNL